MSALRAGVRAGLLALVVAAVSLVGVGRHGSPPELVSRAHAVMGLGLKANTGGFSPSQISGCIAWYRCDLGVTIGTGVSTWADQSGNGNDLVQATGSAQPTYSASCASGAHFGGKCCITFDGVNDRLAKSAIASQTTLNQTVVIAHRILGAPTLVVLQQYSGTGYEYRVNGNLQYSSLLSPTWSSTTAGSSVFGEHRQLRNSLNNYTFGIDVSNGTEVTSTGSQNDLTAAQEFSLGGRSASLFANYETPELAVYNTYLSATDLTTIYNYMKGEYGSL